MHHIVEKRFAPSLNIKNTNDMLSVALTKGRHQVYTNAWRATVPYGTQASKGKLLSSSVKNYYKSPRLLLSAFKTILK